MTMLNLNEFSTNHVVLLEHIFNQTLETTNHWSMGWVTVNFEPCNNLSFYIEHTIY